MDNVVGVNWLSPEELRAWRAFVASYGRLIGELDRELIQDHSLPLAEYQVLDHLAESPKGRLRMHELAELCGLSPSGLTRRFDNMVRAGLVDRNKCDDDRRGVWAVLTEAGRQRFLEASPEHLEAVRRHFIAPIDADQLELLTSICERIATQQRTRVSISV